MNNIQKQIKKVREQLNIDLENLIIVDKRKHVFRPEGCFAYGKLRDILKSKLVYFKHVEKDRVFTSFEDLGDFWMLKGNFSCKLVTGEECVFFIWSRIGDDNFLYRQGIIVLKDDTQYMDYALRCVKERKLLNI